MLKNFLTSYQKKISSNAFLHHIRFLIEKDTSEYYLSDALINTWHKILDEQHQRLCELLVELTKEFYGKTPTISDVKKLIKAYSDDFKRTRLLKFTSNSLNHPKLDKKTKAYNYMLNMRKKGKTDTLELSDIMNRVSRFLCKKDLDVVLEQLELEGRVKLIGNRKIQIVESIFT